MSYLDFLQNHDLNLLLEDYVLSAYLRKRQKDLEDSRSFHENNFQENNDVNKCRHYLISEVIYYIKDGYISTVDPDGSWLYSPVRERITAYNQMVKYF